MDFVRKQAQAELAIRVRLENDTVEAAKQGAAKRVRAASDESAKRRRVADDEAKHRANIEKLNVTFQKRLVREAQREFEASEREKTRALERETRARAAVERKYMRELEREQRDKMFDRKRFYRSIGTGFVEGGREAANLVGNVVRTGVRGIVHGLNLGEATNVGDIVAEHTAVRRAMRATSIEARNAGTGFTFDEAAGAKRVAEVSRRTGVGQRELLKAIDI